jgi:hypothetical protein
MLATDLLYLVHSPFTAGADSAITWANQQLAITAVGTITAGTWNGTVIGATYGGTGVNNGASTITLGGSLTTSGAFASTFTMTGVTSVTFPTSGTLATTASASGIVNSGSINQLAYYAAAGTTLSGLTIVNSAGLLTSAGGVPGWVAYTGTGAPVLAGSPTFTTQITSPTAVFTGATNTNKQYTANSGAAITIDPANGPYQTITLTANTTITMAAVPSSTTEKEFILELVQDGTGGRTVAWSNITFAAYGGAPPTVNTAIASSTYIGISGTSSAWIGYPSAQGLGITSGSAIGAGFIGEQANSTIAIGSATSLTTNTAKTITSLTLQPGLYVLTGNIGIIAASGTLVTIITGSISTTTNTQATSPNGGSFFQSQLAYTASTTQVNPVGMLYVNISVATTYYLVATATFTVSTCTGYGSLTAWRIG